MMIRKVLCLALLSFLAPGSTAWAISTRTLIAPVGAWSSSQFGVSAKSAGDVNRDGYDDIIVGSPGDQSGGFNFGRAFVYFGGPGADNVADWTLTGTQTNGGFGTSVSTAGDVNGDGYDDVIVGEQGNDAVASNAGRAYVYYGGTSPDANPDWILTGAAPEDIFGRSVSTAGDVNRDGYADVIVGAQWNDAGGVDAGRAYVFYGGPGADTVPDKTLTGAAAGDEFGAAVGGAGDVNGDGYADVIVGAAGNDAGGAEAGRAYVYCFLPSGSVSALTLTGAAASESFGGSVGAAGDVNGDGYDDVIVGASGSDAGGLDAGRAYVYFGGPLRDEVADRTMAGVAGDYLGYPVATAGDVNGDGYDDLIVGATGNDGAGQDAGRAYVYFGGPAADASADITLTGAHAFTGLGSAVGAAGDVNGDGYSDLVVGAWQENALGLIEAGRVHVVSVFPYQVLSPNGGEQWVAGRPAVVRWLGHDPADIAVSLDGGATYGTIASGVGGAEENEHSVTVPGPATTRALVRVSQTAVPVRRSTSDASDAAFRIVESGRAPAAASRQTVAPTGAAPRDFFGGSVSTAGDVNGDGYPDFIIGAYGNDAGGADAGRAYVYRGGQASDGVPFLTLTGAAAGDNFGVSAGTAGDVNGDGYADVVVGAVNNDAAGANAGAAYVYHGGPGADAIPDLTLTGAAAGDGFGVTVGTAGDVNGDGYDDVIAGAYGNDAGGSNAGRAYVYFAGPGHDAVADWLLTGEGPSNYFGISVGTAGDVNGDGYADVIVGAYSNQAGGLNAGRAYVYFGGPAADAVADLVLTGETTNDLLGWSVGAAGDVNGDGYADVIVGAAGNDAGGAGAGRAYVLFGGPGADGVADWILTGAAPGDDFGSSVAAAGDVNADGYADVIVGAYLSDGAAIDIGRAYVFFGGPDPDPVADLTFTGAASEDQFGYVAAAAGDLNDDGFSDLIVGASGNDAGGADAGRAYVYHCGRYVVETPSGGETWNVGAIRTISWLGAEPADVWLSTDGGDPWRGHLLESRAGGSEQNSISVRVPHTPTKFGRIHVLPNDPSIRGAGRSDSLFTIQTSVSLLSLLAAALPQGGATISWSTDPGPEDLAGYRVEQSRAGSSEWRPLLALTKETSVADPAGGPGSMYRLFAVNGFGEELWLGETSLPPLTPLRAWPLPYRGGPLTISFATAGGLGGGRARREVALYDVSGRLVRRITRGEYEAGYQTVSWDGRDESGRDVASGIYFLRSSSGSETRTVRLTVLR